MQASLANGEISSSFSARMAPYLSAVFVATLMCMANAGPAGDKEEENGNYCKSSVEQDLDFQKLKGDWWEEESFNTDSFIEKDDKCHVSHFYPSADNKKIEVSHDYISPKDNKHKKVSFVIEDKDAKSDGNLVAQVNILKNGLGKKEVEYDILETDYDNFMLVQICYDEPGTKNDFKAAGMLVRHPGGVALNTVLWADIEAQIKRALRNNNLDRSFFQANDIATCAAVTFPDTFTASK